ncbi:rRNA cytosine-C5-methyltransferase [Dysgonomonas sp. 520]|uniref:methyltransferase RsmF C-terminal domain-like protein n=1 Tax=Dysgonomonas sp. 520 TaxID=2302931 RepID=UPI0013D2BD85|nr:rRNA cytosine-C5-methyltransferase [Dysgonomonas sp. 520]NDW10564.1 rRNA cytosine-C5-methyltransferase [Dysgonomonas sp. 520]
MQLPTSFIETTKPLLKDEWQLFVNALNEESPTSIRINKSKYKGNDLSFRKVPWCEDGYYLEKRPSFTFDPLFHAGLYYVQEASSMFLEQAVKQYVDDDIVALDLCAAPGGKSSHLLNLLSDKSLLVSNEVIRKRADILSENMTKTGCPNVIVTNNDPVDIGKMTHFFDLMLIDAPCSGEGMFRKDQDAVSEWSQSNVQLCKERQQRIVADVWESLKPGGILVYSTCTYNMQENEENVAWIRDYLGADILPLNIPSEWRVAGAYNEDMPVYHFFPHRVMGEGFFMAVLRKKDGERARASSGKNKNGKDKKKATLPKEYREFLLSDSLFTFFPKEDKWFAFPSDLYSCFEYVSSHSKLVSAGVFVGEYKGNDFIPAHSLAMSNYLNVSAFTNYGLDDAMAIAFLKKEALSLNGLPKGYILLTYRGIPVGFVKNIGNRANNLYPQEWRIRSSFVPESINTFL